MPSKLSRARSHSKYSGVLPNLPKLPAADLPYQERVELLKSNLRQDKITAPVALGERYLALRKEKERIEAELYATNMHIEACTQLLLETQERGDEGWGQYGAPKNTLRFKDGSSLRVQAEPYTTIENGQQLRQYFMQNRLASLLTPQWQAVNKLNKDRLLEGEPELPGTKVWVKSKIVPYGVKDEGETKTDDPPSVDLF